ncbi:MAG TPA: hypothetical protein VJP76_01700, partial [Candidatus Tumulicola sp.]|nr:hypothetical protein [Candidatus Tumulicola sp.]
MNLLGVAQAGAASRSQAMSAALGWSVIVLGTVATIGTIVASLYWTIRPGEHDPSHPKYRILRSDR